jgi:hypothetical protein
VNPLEEAVKAMGFASEQEFHHLVSSIRLDSPERFARFKKWQHDDGTKADSWPCGLGQRSDWPRLSWRQV